MRISDWSSDVCSSDLSWSDFIAWLRTGEAILIGTSLATDLDYQQPRYTAPAFILIGNEQAGLPADYEAECDLLVKIPMLGKARSEEHTSELQSLMRISYAVFCLKKKTNITQPH